MGFLDLFKPKLKHNKLELRGEVVENLTGQGVQLELNQNHDNWIPIQTAEKINNQNYFDDAYDDISHNNTRLCDLLTDASQNFRKGEIDSAITKFRKALEIKPGVCSVHQNLATALLKKGDFEASLRSYKRAIELGPKKSDIRRNYGYALQRSGDIDGAIQQYLNSVDLDPYNIVARFNLSRAYQETGNTAAAIEQLDWIVVQSTYSAPADMERVRKMAYDELVKVNHDNGQKSH